VGLVNITGNRVTAYWLFYKELGTIRKPEETAGQIGSNLAKVEVVSSNLIARSIFPQ